MSTPELEILRNEVQALHLQYQKALMDQAQHCCGRTRTRVNETRRALRDKERKLGSAVLRSQALALFG